jgi:hypothetical protein
VRIDLVVLAGVEPPHQVDQNADGLGERAGMRPEQIAPDDGERRRIDLIVRIVAEPVEQVRHEAVNHTGEPGAHA